MTDYKNAEHAIKTTVESAKILSNLIFSCSAYESLPWEHHLQADHVKNISQLTENGGFEPRASSPDLTI